jgi:hypothetical protein
MRKSIILVLLGVGVGCAASVAVPISTSRANGQWGCYVVDRFPDPNEAASWGACKKIKQGMDAVASHVERGTVVVVNPKDTSRGSLPSVVCVKH